MWTAPALGLEGNLFLFWSNTFFKLTLDESMKSFHCSEVCPSCNSSINYWMLLQYSRSQSIEQYVVMSDCLFIQNDTVTYLSRRFHCWSNDLSDWAFVLSLWSNVGVFSVPLIGSVIIITLPITGMLNSWKEVCLAWDIAWDNIVLVI